MEHCMVDIETLGLRKDCKILSVGLAFFNADEVHESRLFLFNLDYQESRSIDHNTVMFWLAQSDEARQELYKFKVENSFESSLLQVKKAIESRPLDIIWANHDLFDLGVLEHAFNSCHIGLPWNHEQSMDYATILKIYLRTFGPPGRPVVSPHIAHSAEGDAVYQAEVLREMTKRIGLTL